MYVNLQGWQGDGEKLKGPCLLGLPVQCPCDCMRNKLNCKSEAYTAGLRFIKNDNYTKKAQMQIQLGSRLVGLDNIQNVCLSSCFQSQMKTL